MTPLTGLIPRILVRTGATPSDRDAAIREAGQLLVAAGCVAPEYVEGMILREAMAETWLGAGVAIPHGRLEDKARVRRDGVAVLQVPEGVVWGPGCTARLIVALAATTDSHMAVLRRLTRLIGDPARLEKVCRTPDALFIEACLGEVMPGGDAVKGCASSMTGGRLETVRFVLPVAALYGCELCNPLNRGGLHARPAAMWAAEARALTVPLCVSHANGCADPRDMLALLQLGVRTGDALDISVDVGTHGRAGAVALESFCRAIAGLTAGEKGDQPGQPGQSGSEAPPQTGWTSIETQSESGQTVSGIGAGPGLAVGVVHRLHGEALRIADAPVSLLEGAHQLEAALETTRLLMQGLVDDTTRRLGPDDAAIFKAQLTLLDDTQLVTLACRHMVDGHGVAWAWNAAVEETAETIAGLSNPQLAGRAADLRDAGRRVLLQLEPELARQAVTEAFPDEPFILVAEDLSPSDTVGLEQTTVAGLVTAQGGASSHTAILARTMGLPAVVAATDVLEWARSGQRAIVDGDRGLVLLEASEQACDAARAAMTEQRARRAADAVQRGLPAKTIDGHRFTILANVNRPDQVPLALEYGAEGVGLMRTEFLFLERGATPDEEAQYAVYAAMQKAVNGRPLVVRALDIGGDKQVAHLALPRETNPFLGVRGARLLLRRGDLFEPQMRALYRVARDASPEGRKAFAIMFAMISGVREVLELKEHCERVRRELDAPSLPIGIMVEIPAAALMAAELAEHVDFFSIGTNDLTQYTLAMDRQNPALAAEADSLHPAVLRLVRLTVEGAARREKVVGVCGGLAGDPCGAVLLAGLGVDELSMTPRDVPVVKAMFRRHSLAELQALAKVALDCADAVEVRKLLSTLRCA